MHRKHKNRVAHNRLNLEGNRYGKLVVLKDSLKRKSKRIIWLCKCDCGNEVEILSKYLLCGDTKSCGCMMLGNAHNRGGYKYLGATYLGSIKRQAKVRGIPFEITAQQAVEQYEKQNKKCALTGVDLNIAINFRDDYINHTASLDRIDNSKGYTVDNIQWVHKVINIMRNKLSIEDFLHWCKMVADKSMVHTPR